MSSNRTNCPSISQLLSLADEMHGQSIAEVSSCRMQLFEEINGDVFFPLSQWPSNMKQCFWRKPMTDQDTFRFLLFMLGNGCSPFVISKWILSSQKWASYATTRRRCYQISWILDNMICKSSTWFSFDITAKMYLHMDSTHRRSQLNE